jgi:DNA-binding transcriptional regulator YiaG
MKKKILKKYIYEGLGFSIELRDVEMVYVDNEWCPKLNVKDIASKVIKLLPFQNERLTGNQIYFIRSFLGMSLRKFAGDVVKESHMAVSKWEKYGSKSTNMDSNTEIVLRLYTYEKLCVKTAREKNNFFTKYQAIKELGLIRKGPEISIKAA